MWFLFLIFDQLLFTEVVYFPSLFTYTFEIFVLCQRAPKFNTVLKCIYWCEELLPPFVCFEAVLKQHVASFDGPCS